MCPAYGLSSLSWRWEERKGPGPNIAIDGRFCLELLCLGMWVCGLKIEGSGFNGLGDSMIKISPELKATQQPVMQNESHPANKA